MPQGLQIPPARHQLADAGSAGSGLLLATAVCEAQSDQSHGNLLHCVLSQSHMLQATAVPQVQRHATGNEERHVTACPEVIKFSTLLQAGNCKGLLQPICTGLL